MRNSPTNEWMKTLDRMRGDVERSLAELDRHEVEWASHLEGAAPSVSPEQLFAWLERRLGAWDSKLSEAAHLAASVEAQLGERETALTRWHGMFLRWREVIQQAKALTGSDKASRTSG
jgi:hypothetical protein